MTCPVNNGDSHGNKKNYPLLYQVALLCMYLLLICLHFVSLRILTFKDYIFPITKKKPLVRINLISILCMGLFCTGQTFVHMAIH